MSPQFPPILPTFIFLTISSRIAPNQVRPPPHNGCAAETMSTLQYAHNAKKIKNKAKVNTLAKAIEIKGAVLLEGEGLASYG